MYISPFIKNRLIEKVENVGGGGYLFNQVIHDGNCFKIYYTHNQINL